ncbi:hypothetical protein [Clostridium sp. YIM B02555]|uniref:hypothetical protein n=1 Tax=Clostridium sp. YIM B02555 TaxID=2911968 RepID=UPI001EEF7382|nr:hypothetical protein [Clostridium sp. YIM B02555]
MKRIILNDQITVIPSIDEWMSINNGIITSIENVSILNNSIFEKAVSYCIDQKALNTQKTLGVLEKRNYRRRETFWPTIIYWPKGCPKIEEGYCSTLEERLFFRVYFHTFKCFKCGLSADGYALERDSYIFKEDELNRVYNSFDFFSLKCPNCSDNMHSPGIVEFTNIFN